MGLIFLLLFVSQWFKQYSIYLAGDRKEKVGSALENGLVDICKINLVDRILYLCSNLWLLSLYVDVFPADFGIGIGASLGYLV